MAVTIKASGPRGAKTYEVRKDGALYDYTDSLHAARKSAARARKESGRRTNPTKAQKRARAAKSSKQRGIVKAVRALLKKTNPSARIVGARVVKLKDGVLKITPVRANRGRR